MLSSPDIVKVEMCLSKTEEMHAYLSGSARKLGFN